VSRIENDDVNEQVSFAAKAVINVQSECVFTLSLENVVSPHAKFVEGLQRYVVEVHMDNGMLKDLHHDPRDPVWALNAKRAVISMLQAPLDASIGAVEITETDVLGECKTSYTPESSTEELAKITKTKKLLSCQGRFQAPGLIFSTPYNAQLTDIRTVPLADGTYSCMQVMNKQTGVMQKVECQQSEKLYISKQASPKPGVISVMRSEVSMELVSAEGDYVAGPDTSSFKPASLVFDSKYIQEQHNGESLVIAVNRYCELMKTDVRPETGKAFGDLIKSMRTAHFDKILGVYQMLDDKPCDTEKLRKVFLDVLGMAGTPGAVKMMAEFMQNGERKELHAQWLASLSYMTKPTEETVKAMIPVVENADVKQAKQVYLRVSAMTNTFCKLHGEGCEEVPAVRKLLGVLVSKLGAGCSADREQVVAALKALGNLGVMADFGEQVFQCMTRQSTDLQLYTMTAFRKVCQPKMTAKMISTYADQAQDSEIRIAAYLNSVRCASEDDIEEIVRVYENEKIVQVGSFVYSHMKAVQESSCPIKAELKRMITAHPVSARFSRDPSKYSQYFEYSKFFESVNTGVAADASVVFSPKSFLPRSAHMNLTLDAFSHSFNFLEVGGRVEGLEKVLEGLIGPTTALGKGIANELSRRQTRSTDQSSFGRFDNEVDIDKDPEQKLSFYVNVHGNEIDYVEFASFKELTAKMMNSAVQLMRYHPNNVMNEIAIQGQIDIAKNVVLFDDRVTASTILGVGLVSEIRTVANMVLKASAPMPDGSGLIKASLEPSAVLQVDVSLTLDAGVFRHGSRVATTLHTSSVVDIEITKRDDEFKFRFNTPRDKIELLNAKSEVFIIRGDFETPFEIKNKRPLNGCTVKLPEILGMTACVAGEVPQPWYIARRGFVRPFNFALTLEKTDKDMEGIEFTVQRGPGSWSATLDTPGSKTDRRRELHFKLSTRHQMFESLDISARCPAREVSLNVGGMTDDFTNWMRVLITDRQTSKTDEYGIFVKALSFREIIFKATCPHLKEPAKLFFNLHDDSIELESNYPEKNPLRFKSSIAETATGVVYTTNLSVADLNAVSKWNIDSRSREAFHASFVTEYAFTGHKAEQFTYELSLKKPNTPTGYQLSGTSTWKSTCHPQYNNKLTFHAQSVADSRKHKLQFWWGEKFDDEGKTVKINIDARKKGDFRYGSATTLQLYAQAYSPEFGVNYDVKYTTKVDLQRSMRLVGELIVNRDDDTIVKFDALFERNSPRTTLKLALIAPNTKLSLTDESEEIARGKYKGNSEIEWGFNGQKLQADYETELLGDGNHELKMILRAPNMKPIEHRHLIRLARDIQLETQTMIDGKEYIVFEIKKEDQSLAFNFIGQKVQVKYTRDVKDKAVDIKLDIKSKVIYTRPISLVIHKDSPGKKTHELTVDLRWDAVANPDKRLNIVLNTNREDGVKSDARIEITNLLKFTYKGVYVKGFIKGPNRAEFHLSGPKFETRELIVGHQTSKPKGEGYLTYTRGGKTLVDAKIGHEFTEAKRYYYLIVTGVVNRKLTINRDLTNRVLTVDLDRDGKLYSLVIDRKTVWAQGVIDTKVTLKTPYERFLSQEFTAKGTIADGKIDLTVHFLAGSGRNYHFVVKGTRPAPLNLDVEIDIKTDLDELKEGKAHLKYKLDDPANREILLTVERTGETVVDFHLKAEGTDAFNRVIVTKFSSKWTPSYVHKVTIAGSKAKFSSDTTVSKDGVEGYFTAHVDFEHSDSKLSYHGVYHGGFFGGDTEIIAERHVLPGDNHRTYKLNIKRNERELKADAETQRENGYKITSVNVCRTPLDSNCVSVTVKRNVEKFHYFRNKDINIKIHRKPDVTFEIDSQSHIPADVHEAHVRLVGAINEFKLGFDYHCDHKTEQLSQQTLKGYIVDKEMLATRRREQTDKFIDIKYTATFDAKTPEEGLTASYRRDYNDKGYTSVALLTHPKMKAPIKISSDVSRGKDENSIIRIESKLEWLKPEDSVYLHYERRLNDVTPRNRSLHFHIHKEDKTDFDWSVTLYRSQDLEKPVFAGYMWSYITAKKEQREGSLRAFLGADLKGSIEFKSPYQDDFTITGEAKVLNDQGDKEAEIVHLKNGVETKGKISYNVQKAYVKAVVLDASGAEKRELEIDGGRKEQGRYKLVLSSFPEGKKTTDLGIEHTRTSETAFHSRVFLPPEYLKKVAERAKEIAASRAGKYPIEDIKEELKSRADVIAFKLRKTFEDLPEHILTKVSQIFVDVQGSLSRLINNTTVGQRLKAKLEANKEKIGQLLKCFIDLVRKCCPTLADKLEARLEKYIPKRTRRSVDDERRSLVAYVMERWDSFTDWLLDMPVVKVITNAYQKAVSGVEWVGIKVWGVYEKTKRAFLGLPDIKQIAETWQELYDSSSVGQLLPSEAMVKYVLKPRIEAFRSRLPVFEIDRKAGKFVADIDVPADAKQLVKYFTYGVSRNSRGKTRQQSNVDLVTKTLEKLYDGRATIMEGKHFITFDGQHFSAAGDCSYLLARDFSNGSFSVAMRTAGDKPTYMIQIERNLIELTNGDDGYAVSVNGHSVSLPYPIPNGVILQGSGRKIVVKDSRYLQFTLYPERNLATLDLRMWSFARTAGLLGNYNREPSDDFKTPSGESVSDEQAFLNAWQIGDACGTQARLFRERSEDVEAVDLCDAFFKKDDSTLAVGFLLRRADRFHDLCLRAAHQTARKLETVCRVAHAYLLDVERFADLPGYLGARLPNDCRKYA